MENVMNKKSDKLSVKWKGYDNSLNSWINANAIVQHINITIVSKYFTKPYSRFG